VITTQARRGVLVAVLSLTLTGCATQAEQTGSTPPTPTTVINTLDPQNIPAGKTGQPRGGVIEASTVNNTNADAVATAAVETMYRYDTRLDNTPMDATRRARPWLTSDYAVAVAKPMPGDGGADWITLAKHDGYTITSVKDAHDDGAPPDDPTHASRQRVVTVIPHGSAGWTSPPTVVTVFVTLVRPTSSAPWQISGVTTA
jgi:hypothetical protein